MATILVLYASHYGQTRAIAQEIAGQLRLAHHDVELVDAMRTTPPRERPSASTSAAVSAAIPGVSGRPQHSTSCASGSISKAARSS